MESLRIVKLWAAAAWADGTLHRRESEALRRLIDASTEMTADERREALAVLEAPPVVDLTEVQKLSPDAREGVYRAVLGIVRLDGKVTDDERDFLARLRGTLGLDEKIVARIEAERH